MKEHVEVSDRLPVQPTLLYQAWLDSEQHSAFTGGAALIEATVGGRFSAWDGYITGKTLHLEPGRRIVQSWRTSDFSEDDDDSRVEVLFEPTDSGTLLRIIHSDIPPGQGNDYERGWTEFYFSPMKQYFGLHYLEAKSLNEGTDPIDKPSFTS